jgi:hypothetical protein
VYIGFASSVSCHNQNLVFVAWLIYSTTNQLVYVGGVCLGSTTNNVVEYSVVIELL